jgi:hypothetical protein
MEHKRFEQVCDDIYELSRSLMISKNDHYARGDDKLHNFKKAAGFGGTQETALAGMMLKHTVSIYDLVDDLAGGNNAHLDLWREKILDHINYLILLYAMQVERDDMFKDREYDVPLGMSMGLAGRQAAGLGCCMPGTTIKTGE